MQVKELSRLFVIIAVFLGMVYPALAADPTGFDPVKGYEFLASKNEN